MPDIPTPGPEDEARRALVELNRRARENRLKYYAPYPKQRVFHDAGLTHRERLFRAGNQLGKTLSGGMEAAMHLTGRYPDWWRGRRFEKPQKAWMGSLSGEFTRDNQQAIVFGEGRNWGTGTIPSECLDLSSITMHRHGVADLIDFAAVRHESGGWSKLWLKNYGQDPIKWAGATLDWVWFDEEPPENLYVEGLSRTTATGGMVWLTFTPLLGASEVVQRFLNEDNPSRHDTNMTDDEAPHLTDEQREINRAGWPEHQREARSKGIPILGSGKVFPVTEASITIEPIPIPDHWVWIGALDFGFDHPTAAVKIAYDRDADIMYVVLTYRAKQKTPAEHAMVLRHWGPELPWCWPHDGNNDTAAGANLASQYRAEGMKMLPTNAKYPPDPDGKESTSVEAGLTDLLTRMQTGRFKVFSTCTDWFEECRLYHRKDGQVVKKKDDLMSATRYGGMSLRFATSLVPQKMLDPRRRRRGHRGANRWMGT